MNPATGQPVEENSFGEALWPVCLRLSTQTGEMEGIRALVEETRLQPGTGRVAVWLYNNDHTGLCGTYGTDDAGNTRDDRMLFFPFADTGRELFADNRDTPPCLLLTSETTATLPDPHPFRTGAGTREKLVAAIPDGKTILGALVCDNPADRPPFSPEQVKSLRLLALFLGQFIAGQRLLRDRDRQKQEMLQLEKHLIATQRLESLGIMAGGLAHDFNNMLTGILGNTSLALLKLPANSPARESLLRVEAMGLQAAEGCNQLLAFSGKRAGTGIKTNDLNHLIREARHFFRLSVPKAIALDFELAGTLPPIHADETQIRQLILNLLVNASEAIGGQPGRIEVATAFAEIPPAVRERCHGKDNLASGPAISLRITDTGCGISSENLARIFDPFFTTKFTSRGLGLAAVLDIVHTHSAAIDVENPSGKGTTFTVFFRPASTPAPSVPAPPPRGSEPTGKQILIVDDDPGIRALAARALALAGYKTLSAEDGVVALEIYKKEQNTIGLILLDLTMPVMDGHQVLRAVREINPDIPVLVMSGYTEHELALQFQGVSPNGFIQKPFLIATLVKWVESTIR